jgi:predicted Zn-dependent peptidase
MLADIPRPLQAVMPNGLKVITTQVPWARTVSINLAVKVGSRDEEPDKGGLAHFAEHLCFRGTPEYPTETELGAQLFAIGAQTNASTSFDLTQYQFSVPPEGLPRALQLLASMVHQPTLNGLEIERRIVLAELRMYEGIAWSLSDGEHHTLRPLFHPSEFCRGPTVGTVNSVEALTLEDLRAFYARFYVAKNMVLSISGPLSAAQVGAAAAPFSQLAPGNHHLRALPPPPRPGAMHHDARDEHRSELRMIFPLVAHPPSHDAEWTVLSLLLQGGHGLLHRALRSIRGLVYSHQARQLYYSDFGTQHITLEPNASDPITGLKQVLDVLAALKRAPPSPADLAGAKLGARHWQAGNLENPWSYCGDIAWAAIFGWPIDPQKRADRLAAVTGEGVQLLAQQLFKTGAGHLFYSGPSKHEKTLWKMFKAL